MEIAEPETVAPDPSERLLSVWLTHGRWIEVKRGFDALTLRQLLRVLKSA